MIAFKLPDDAVNKALSDLAFKDIQDVLSSIGWDLNVLIGPPKVMLMVSAIGPDYELRLTARINTPSGEKLASVKADITHHSLLAVADQAEHARMISMHVQSMAREMVGGILKEYGTDVSEERKRRYEALKAQASNPNFVFPIVADPSLSPGEMKMVTPDGRETVFRIKEETVQEAVDERKKNAKWKID